MTALLYFREATSQAGNHTGSLRKFRHFRNILTWINQNCKIRKFFHFAQEIVPKRLIKNGVLYGRENGLSVLFRKRLNRFAYYFLKFEIM